MTKIDGLGPDALTAAIEPIRLLLVEDDESVRTLAARALEKAGHLVEIACDGEEGLSRIVDAQGRYDLIVSDIPTGTVTASGFFPAEEVTTRPRALAAGERRS